MAEKWMNTGSARGSATDLDAASKKIDKAEKSIDGLVNQLKAVWWGDDQKRFESKWTGGYKADLTDASKTLHAAAENIRSEATQQDKTSS
jgi:uncharacterized protein YukE